MASVTLSREWTDPEGRNHPVGSVLDLDEVTISRLQADGHVGLVDDDATAEATPAAEPDFTGPTKALPGFTGPTKTEPGFTGPTKTEPGFTGPTKTDPEEFTGPTSPPRG
jgi:hypothetical protein